MERSRLMLGFKLLFSLVACQFVVVIGQVIANSSFESWYSGLETPVFAFPFSLFIPLRAIVLILLGLALFLVWIRTDKPRRVREAFLLFMIQIALNVILNIIFLGFRSSFGAFIISVPTVILAIMVTRKTYQVSRWAGMLTLPYLTGIIYTLFFNLSLFIMNK